MPTMGTLQRWLGERCRAVKVALKFEAPRPMKMGQQKQDDGPSSQAGRLMNRWASAEMS